MAQRAPKLVSDLLSAVKRKLFWDSSSTGNAHYTDAELTAIAQELKESKLYPAISSAKGHCLTSIQDVALVSSVLYDAMLGYSVPIESMAKIESVSYVDSTGSEYALEEYREREWVKYESYPSNGTGPYGYAFRGGRLHLYPHPSTATGKLIRIRYVARPMTMSSDSAALYRRLYGDDPFVTTNNGTDVVEVEVDSTLAGTSWLISSDSEIDVDLQFLTGAAPHVPLDLLSSAGASTGGTLATGTLLDIPIPDVWPSATNNPLSARVGDLVIADYTTPIVQLPIEGFNLLKVGVAAEVAGSLGDKDQADRFTREFEAGLAMLPGQLVPRAIAQPDTWVNHASPGRTRNRWRWR